MPEKLSQALRGSRAEVVKNRVDEAEQSTVTMRASEMDQLGQILAQEDFDKLQEGAMRSAVKEVKA